MTEPTGEGYAPPYLPQRTIAGIGAPASTLPDIPDVNFTIF